MISIEFFAKIYSLKDKKSGKNNRISYGTVHLRFYNVETFYRINGFIASLIDNFNG